MSESKSQAFRSRSRMCAEIKDLKAQLNSVEEGCTPTDAKKLREFNHGLAAEVEQLKAKVAELENEVKNYDFAAHCIDSDLDSLQGALPKIKADAIRVAGRELCQSRIIAHIDESIVFIDDLNEHADKLEAGKL